MFLNLLNESEKHVFISLAIRAAESNGVVEKEEIELINDYCREMMLNKIDVEKYIPESMENIVEILSSSEKSHKKIVLFEIMGLLNVDSEFDEKEKNFIYEFGLQIGIKNEELDQLRGSLDRYLKVVNYVTEELMK